MARVSHKKIKQLIAQKQSKITDRQFFTCLLYTSHPPKQKKNPMDINYDGYYNDVKPIDAGQQRDRLDPELIKKVILLVAGALGVILLAIAFMALL